jgi:hypothetical protein
MKLTTHLHLVPRLRMSGAIPLLPYTLSVGAFIQCLMCTESEPRHALIPNKTEQCVCACVFVEIVICVLQYKCLNLHEFLIHI